MNWQKGTHGIDSFVLLKMASLDQFKMVGAFSSEYVSHSEWTGALTWVMERKSSVHGKHGKFWEDFQRAQGIFWQKVVCFSLPVILPFFAGVQPDCFLTGWDSFFGFSFSFLSLGVFSAFLYSLWKKSIDKPRDYLCKQCYQQRSIHLYSRVLW